MRTAGWGQLRMRHMVHCILLPVCGVSDELCCVFEGRKVQTFLFSLCIDMCMYMCCQIITNHSIEICRLASPFKITPNSMYPNKHACIDAYIQTSTFSHLLPLSTPLLFTLVQQHSRQILPAQRTPLRHVRSRSKGPVLHQA